MRREISQRELRNDSGSVMRRVDAGESFVVTRNGLPVAQLLPFPRDHFIPKERVLAELAGIAKIDSKSFREDVDALVDESIDPLA